MAATVGMAFVDNRWWWQRQRWQQQRLRTAVLAVAFEVAFVITAAAAANVMMMEGWRRGDMEAFYVNDFFVSLRVLVSRAKGFIGTHQ